MLPLLAALLRAEAICRAGAVESEASSGLTDLFCHGRDVLCTIAGPAQQALIVMRTLNPACTACTAAERKPVGTANMLLSVANFNEALRVPQVHALAAGRAAQR